MENKTTKEIWLGFIPFLFNLFLLMFILMLSSPALPYITNEFQLTIAQAPWQNTLYTMAAAILSPLLGWIGDKYGQKKQVAIGLTVFIIGNLFCAVSPNFVVFCLGRFLAGFGPAAIMPAAMGYIVNQFPAEKTVSAFAVVNAFSVLGCAVGPTAAGVLINYVSWRQMFFVSSLVMIAGMVITLICVKDHKGEASDSKLDAVGMATLFISMASMLSLLTLSSQLGWLSPAILGLLAVFAVTFILFYRHEKSTDQKLIDVSLLTNRRFMLPSLLQFIQCGISGFVSCAIVYYMTLGLGLGSSVSGLWMSLYSLIAFPLSFIVGKVSQRFKARSICMVCVAAYAVSILVFCVSSPSMPLVFLFASAVVISAANAFVPSVCNAVALEGIPAEQSGAASGTVQMIMNLGSPVVIAVIVPYMSIIGAKDGVPDYLVSFPAVSRIMLILVAIAVALVLAFPKTEKK